jgi:TPR repeat protein
VGNLYADGDLESIWHGPTMTELRQAILENRLHPVCIGSSCVYIKGAVSEEQDDNHVAQKDRLKAMADSGSGWAAAVYGSSKLFDGDFTEAEQYFALGVVLLGTVLVEHDASPAGLSEARERFIAAANRGRGEVCFCLGQMYESGGLGFPDLAEALRNYRLAETRNHPAAAARVA